MKTIALGAVALLLVGHCTGHEGAQTAVAAAQSSAALLHGVAKAEGRLARSGRREMREAREIADEVEEVLGDENPRAAAKVQSLMKSFRGRAAALSRHEGAAARRLNRLAMAQLRLQRRRARALAQRRHRARRASLLRRLHRQRRARHHSAAARSRVHAATGAEAGAQLARFAGMEERVASDDRSTFHAMKQVSQQAREALEDADAGPAADKVAALLAQATSEQRKVAMTEHHEAREERQLAQEIAGRRTRGVALVETAHSSRDAAQATVSDRVAREANMLSARSAAEVKAARESEKITAEVGRANSAVDKALHGTRVGEEVEALLRKAAGAASDAGRSERQEAAATRREATSVAELERRLRGGRQ